jgi:hypothetical protein
VKYSRPGPTQADLTKTRDRMGGSKGPNVATQPLPGSAPSKELTQTGALTAEQEALATRNRVIRAQQRNAQIRKVQGALAGSKVAISLAKAQQALTAATPPAAKGTDALLS